MWPLVVLVSIIWICTTVVIVVTDNVEIVIATFLTTILVIGLTFLKGDKKDE